MIDFEGNKELGVWEYGIVTLQNFSVSACEYKVCSGDFEKNFETFASKRRSGIFCAHSAQVEDGLLRYYWASPGQVPFFFKDGTTLSWGPWLDTKMIYRKLFKGLPSYELGDLVSTFSLKGELIELANKYCSNESCKFHHALFDALAAALLLRNLGRYYADISIKKLLLI